MKISLGTTYYNNPENIKEFVDRHLPHVDELIIVDDHSDDIYNISRYVTPSDKIKLYRVCNDYGFNSHGARNLIMKQAENEFVILLDSDRVMEDPAYAIQSIKNRKLSLNTLYRFIAHKPRLGRNLHHSVNDFLVSKTHFFSAGGYDEELIGIRDGDRQYFEQLLFYGNEKILYDIHIVLTREATLLMTGEEKKRLRSSNDKRFTKTILDLLDQRTKKPEPNKKILTFEWERLFD